MNSEIFAVAGFLEMGAGVFLVGAPRRRLPGELTPASATFIQVMTASVIVDPSRREVQTRCNL